MTNPTQINQDGSQTQKPQASTETGELQRETGEFVKGPKPSNLGGDTVLSEGGPGEARTPDRRIGQVAHADHEKQTQGGAGEPQSSRLEPENQGGIGGP
jgi:hypothetical protein